VNFVLLFFPFPVLLFFSLSVPVYALVYSISLNFNPVLFDFFLLIQFCLQLVLVYALVFSKNDYSYCSLCLTFFYLKSDFLSQLNYLAVEFCFIQFFSFLVPVFASVLIITVNLTLFFSLTFFT
jgi:hypothetical protein